MVDSFLSGKVNILDVAPHFLGVNILATDSGVRTAWKHIVCPSVSLEEEKVQVQREMVKY